MQKISPRGRGGEGRAPVPQVADLVAVAPAFPGRTVALGGVSMPLLSLAFLKLIISVVTKSRPCGHQELTLWCFSFLALSSQV